MLYFFFISRHRAQPQGPTPGGNPAGRSSRALRRPGDPDLPPLPAPRDHQDQDATLDPDLGLVRVHVHFHVSYWAQHPSSVGLTSGFHLLPMLG